MSDEQILLSVIGALVVFAAVNVGLVYRDRRRSNRRLAEVLASAKRESAKREVEE